MKKILFIISIASLVFNANAQQPTKENIYTLKPNESLVYGENCFYFSDQGKSIFFVLKANEGFYTVSNGVRKGPFKEMNDNLITPCKENNNSSCAAYEPNVDSEDFYSKYVMANDDGSFTIKFNGKTYGPFANLLFFQTNENKSAFAASVTDMSLGKKLIFSNGKSFPIDGMVGSIKFSPDGSFALARVGFDYQSGNFDPSKINMEQITSFTIITSDGAKFGPFNGEKVTESDIWFTKTTGNHWFIRNDNNLLLDGKPFMKMPENSGRCDLWFSADCKRYAVAKYDNVRFSDNSTIPYPIQTSLFYKDGKAYLRCVTIENEKEINVYTKAL